MSSQYADKSIVDIQTLFRDINKNPITTAVGKITVQRLDNKQYLQLGLLTFGAAPVLLDMTKISDVNSPGLWEFLLDTSTFPPLNYLFITSDENAIPANRAANSPQTASVRVGDKLSNATEAGASAAKGKATYDPVTSIETLYKHDDSATIEQAFNKKDQAGNPAKFNPSFERDPF